MERQGTDQEKIFANHMANKGFISRIYKEHSNHSSFLKMFSVGK